MLVNKKIALFLCLWSLCLFSACEKKIQIDDSKKVQVDYSKFEGSFYGERYIEGHIAWAPRHPLGRHDRVADLVVENDSLKLLGYSFKIDSESQTLFENHLSTLLFSNNYNSIQLSNYDPSSNFFRVDSFIANRDIAGMYKNVAVDSPSDTAIYTLSVHERSKPETYTGPQIDTQYMAELLVEIRKVNDRILVTIDNQVYPHYTDFWSTYGYRESDGKTETIYWQSDSLYLESIDYLANGPSQGFDSVIVVYQGVKK